MSASALRSLAPARASLVLSDLKFRVQRLRMCDIVKTSWCDNEVAK